MDNPRAFENAVVRDLRVYAQALEAQVYRYRDESGLEADAVIEMPDGRQQKGINLAKDVLAHL